MRLRLIFYFEICMNAVTLPENLLRPLCKPFSNKADRLLDLYEMTRAPQSNAGGCLKCFYALLEGAEPSKISALNPLKAWIESNMEVLMKDGGQEKSSMPVSLNAIDFESFCQDTLQSAHRDAALTSPLVELQLTFKRVNQAA